MAARKAADKAEAPKKLDATPQPAPAEPGFLRAKASRPTFRRGGLVFNDRTFVDIAPDIGPEAATAIFAEPVLTVQINDPKAGWRAVSAEERAEIVEAAAEAEAARAADQESGRQ